MEKTEKSAAQRRLELGTNIFALSAQSVVYCKMVETISDVLGNNSENALKILMLLAQHGNGLIRKGDVLLADYICDDELKNWIISIQRRINLRINILINEMVKIKSEIDTCPENVIASEISAEIEKRTFKYLPDDFDGDK